MIGWIFKLFAGGNPIGLAIVAAAIAAAGFGTGWSVNGWRLGARIERLEGTTSALQAANQRCGVNVAEVKAAVAGLVDAAEKRADEGRKAIARAEVSAVKHINRAAGIIARPPVPPEKQCDTVREEQIDYVRMRRGED